MSPLLIFSLITVVFVHKNLWSTLSRDDLVKMVHQDVFSLAQTTLNAESALTDDDLVAANHLVDSFYEDPPLKSSAEAEEIALNVRDKFGPFYPAYTKIKIVLRERLVRTAEEAGRHIEITPEQAFDLWRLNRLSAVFKKVNAKSPALEELLSRLKREIGQNIPEFGSLALRWGAFLYTSFSFCEV